MEEEILNESFPYLKELENKIGRKTPPSLLVWMRDAAECDDGWRSERECSAAFSDNFSDKIRLLKREMSGLRSADVRILRQLVAVHEGIEAMRWLMEERDALVSRSSSLTGSLTSLVTLEGHGPPMSPCRENFISAKDVTESTGEESEDHLPHVGHDDSKSVAQILEISEARSPHPFTAACGTHGTHTSSSPANSLKRSQRGNSEETPFQDIKSGANTIRRALLRSSWVRREVRVDNIFETQRKDQSLEGIRNPNTLEKEESPPNEETLLPGYDAQWCWVESKDDVTFL